ncbi:ABC-2 family transporter protein [bacterium]|nr:ABC-2 family transporter protein [bacterium]
MKRWEIEDWFHSFRVYLAWVKMVWLRHLQYRFNAFASSLGTLFWIFGTLITYRLIFNRVNTLAGWSWQQMLVLYGIYNLWWGLMNTFFNGGLKLADYVRQGGLDSVLLWPGKALFYASMKFEPVSVVHSLVGVIIFLFSLKTAAVEFRPGNFFLAAVLLLNSFLLAYFVSILFGVSSFWWVENRNFTEFFWLWETLAKYPSEFFADHKLLYWAVYSILPVVFIAVVPAEVILGKTRPMAILGAFLVTIFFGFLTQKVWSLGLKRYTGVSR